ncbi:NAD+ synthase [Amphiplicatus metriothermophilus]|uniref:NAD+ synthase n=1 Tax=Amphiplicatus metriothermophilus TaxID=1519374 RepID=UPI000B77415E|nr:NAD+ synthase [Amphiplicatus metriothermophilus]MBB5517429.1 NAD+ synthase [Amphiplicatus metriothermophilus]
MTERLSIAIAQIAPVVGDVAGNVARIRRARAEAAALGADLVVYCELCVSGYPPEDLVRKPAYQRACRAAVEALAADTGDGGPAMIVGAPWKTDEADKPYNAAFLLDGGLIAATRCKCRLPNYGVFDEPRHFEPAVGFPQPTEFRGAKLGLMICEDMWIEGAGEALAAAGADFFIVPHGSPFRKTALAERTAAARARCRATGRPLVFVNQLAGQDEVVFEGAAFVMDAHGEVVFRAPQFEEGVFLTEWRREASRWICADGPKARWIGGEEMVYRAVVLGARDYIEKNRFPGVVIGLSGGVDSALTAAIAVDALGPERVRCVMMPSRFTSKESLQDAEECAAMLGVSYETIPIEPAVAAFEQMLAPVFRNLPRDATEENIQSRIRGVLLMALSNKSGWMVLTTGNKSEMSVGYATLYGDMNGGYNPLKDIYKTEVYALARWRNARAPAGLKGPAGLVIPERILTKAPSAELRAGQTDQDSLPPYDALDPILERLVEKEMAVRDIVAEGYDEATVRRIEHMLYVAEYKRRQAPPGPKVTAVNFGRDRRYPITNGWRDRDAPLV